MTMNNLKSQSSENYSVSSLNEEAQSYIERIIAKSCLGLQLTKEEETALERTKARAILYSQR